MGLRRLAILADYPEEGWPSMDLCAEMLSRGLDDRGMADVRVARVCPAFRRRAGRLPMIGKGGWATNADRLLNRLWDYPRHLRRWSGEFDLFHVCDHSYSHLVHVLPGGRTGVFCHDLDTFRCLLEPGREPRPRWFRVMMRKVLRGMQKAAVVFHTTAAVRRQILDHGLIDPARLVQAPLGVAPEFTPEPVEDLQAAGILASLHGAPFLLHVGSCVPRKRMDVLLDVFARARTRRPGLWLVKVGGPWSAEQRGQIDRLGVGEAIVQVSGLERKAIAALYRRAALVLVPSAAEGFGLPVLEALASGGLVVASDLPALREVGGEAVVYCPVGDVPAWAGVVERLLVTPWEAPGREARLAQARRFSWAAHAWTILDAYRRLG